VIRSSALTEFIMTNQDFFFRLVIGLVLSGCVLWGLYARGDEEKTWNPESGQQKYDSLFPPLFLPFLVLSGLFCMAIFSIWAVLENGSFHVGGGIIFLLFGVFLQLSVYCILLSAAMPLLRKHFRPRSCALLWLVPNWLYILYYFFQGSYFQLQAPSRIFYVPGRLAETLVLVWTAGFLLVLSGKILSHHLFRRQVLRESRQAADPSILQLWEETQKAAGVQKPYTAPVYSPRVKTPLSFGFSAKRACLVLPDRSYTPEELSLIFRHEIIHIQRQDSSSKFYMQFCCAMCWFNPFVWLSMRRSAEDLELSCDEAVLHSAEEADRDRYARLILETAGDGRGFTTCLSAHAESLRYRLRNIMNPRRYRKGYVVIALVLFLLIMSFGQVTVAYSPESGSQSILMDSHLEKIDFIRTGPAHVHPNDTTSVRHHTCTDPEALANYLGGLQLWHLAGNYGITDIENQWAIRIRFRTGASSTPVLLEAAGHALMITRYDSSGRIAGKSSWYLPEGIDMDYIERLLEVYPA